MREIILAILILILLSSCFVWRLRARPHRAGDLDQWLYDGEFYEEENNRYGR